MAVLVLDAGTSGVRAGVVGADGGLRALHHREVLPSSPAPGLVEIDPVALADAALDVAHRALAEVDGPVAGVGVTNQRATTVVWRRSTGEPVGPGLGWQDLRTVGTCLELGARGVRAAPNASATKAWWLLQQAGDAPAADLCIGTVDSWLVWHLTEGRHHVTDPSNAGMTDLWADGGWGGPVLEALDLPIEALPVVVDSTAVVGPATAVPGAPVVCGIAGDQQAALVGQGCVRPGLVKATFGTGAMLDVCLGTERPAFDRQGPGGTFPIMCWRHAGATTWGVEAAMLTAGSAVEWLRDGLGLVDDAAATSALAARCAGTGDVWFVPALSGLGAPYWDFGATGTLLGVTGGTGRAELARAVLEGVAHRGADLVEAAAADTGLAWSSLRIDGGMSANEVFVQALADAAGLAVEVSPHREATTVGAGLLAGVGAGVFESLEATAGFWSPARVVEPGRPADRERWRQAVERARRWDEGASAISF